MVINTPPRPAERWSGIWHYTLGWSHPARINQIRPMAIRINNALHPYLWIIETDGSDFMGGWNSRKEDGIRAVFDEWSKVIHDIGGVFQMSWENGVGGMTNGQMTIGLGPGLPGTVNEGVDFRDCVIRVYDSLTYKPWAVTIGVEHTAVPEDPVTLSGHLEDLGTRLADRGCYFGVKMVVRNNFVDKVRAVYGDTIFTGGHTNYPSENDWVLLWGPPWAKTIGYFHWTVNVQWSQNYFCSSCGYKYKPSYVYDEANHRVTAPDLFDSLPESWTCPRCGGPKSGFDNATKHCFRVLDGEVPHEDGNRRGPSGNQAAILAAIFPEMFDDPLCAPLFAEWDLQCRTRGYKQSPRRWRLSLDSSPVKVPIKVDGTPYQSPVTIELDEGEHTLETPPTFEE